MKLTLIALMLAGVVAQGADDWSAYGRDAGGTRYSPLKQIHKGNVASECATQK